MGNKVNFVKGKLVRKIVEYTLPEFYSKHNQEDIEEWLEEGFIPPEDPQDFTYDWEYDDTEVEVEGWSINERDLKYEPECEHDDQIQEWIDGKPQREKETEEYYQSEDYQKLKPMFNKVEKIKENLKKKDYILTIYQTGDDFFSNGDRSKQVHEERYFQICSLEEIPDLIKGMTTPFWYPTTSLSEEEKKNYPYEKKKWGIYRNIVIEPLSEEMEKDYLDSSKKGFFETWRSIRDYDENPWKEIMKRYRDSEESEGEDYSECE